MTLLSAIPFLKPLIDKITNQELIAYLKEQNASKEKQIEVLQNKLIKHYQFKSKGKK